MSIKYVGDSLLWLSLFSIPESGRADLIKAIKEAPPACTGDQLAAALLNTSPLSDMYYLRSEPAMHRACQRVALEFALFGSDFAKTLLSEDELGKAQDLFARKQYNSKHLSRLLSMFVKMLTTYEQRHQAVSGGVQTLFTSQLLKEYRLENEAEISYSYGPIKRLVDKIASGVKSTCYKDAERTSIEYLTSFTDELNEAFKKITGYDHNKSLGHRAKNMSTLFMGDRHTVSNRIMQLAFIDDVEFWSKHERFSVIAFLNSVNRENGIRHAEKLWTHIFENLKNMPNMDKVLEQGYPLCASKYDELVKRLEEQAMYFTFRRLSPYCSLDPLKGVALCLPMSKADHSHIELGRQIWDGFIREYNYPDSYEKVENYINGEIEKFVSGEDRGDRSVAVILDGDTFRYSANSEDRCWFELYHPDCFSADNIWKRVYLKAYAVSLLSDDKETRFSYLQRIFVSLIKTVETKLNVCTAHQLDTKARDEAYEKLKKILGGYGISISDEHKANYVTSLLDRDTATEKESSSFQMLEQLGDAIYGFAVAEGLFYNPDSLFYPENSYDPSGNNIEERHRLLTEASAQIPIAKKLGFDNLYLHMGLPAKYVEYDTLYYDIDTKDDERLQVLNLEKYLADTLEMVIGAIYLDLGIDAAMSFIKRALRETYPKHFSNEVHPSEENIFDGEIDWEYWARILPGIHSEMTCAHSTVSDALDKLALTVCVGTEDKKARRFISSSYGSTYMYGVDQSGGVNWPLFDYLHSGLAHVLKKYGGKIKDYYESYSK
ncbi:MAG: hypothetical protein IJE25_08520 [Clostridia bacterium]|nr:hypothetical protein [Clostridia bacterium]